MAHIIMRSAISRLSCAAPAALAKISANSAQVSLAWAQSATPAINPCRGVATSARQEHTAASAATGSSGTSTGTGPHRGMRALIAALFAGAAGTSLGALQQGDWEASTAQCKAEEVAAEKGAIEARVYTKDDVAEHNSAETGVWVTYKDGVYDISDFIAQHPGGGKRIMLAAGGSIDKFWSMYAQHQKTEVKDLLEKYRIGSLEGGAVEEVTDPYGNDPRRHPALIVRSAKPFSAETPTEILGEQLNTPNELFYVRHHLPVPQIKAADYRLVVKGEGLRNMELTLEDLKAKFKHHTVSATLQCTGNRRHEINEIKPVQGLDWDIGAIGNATWTGVRLSDVLKYAGYNEDTDQDVRHVQFEGYDQDTEGTRYGASIPVERASDPHSEVLLAFEMNGEELPADHGYPVRLVAPGITGARSVKWLRSVVASREESGSHWQQKDYKSFNPSVDWDTVDWSSAPAIQDTPVTSAITEPKAGDEIEGPTNEVTVKGYAWAGGGKGVIRVDVTADGGKTWISADLKQIPQRWSREWAWCLWEVAVPLPEGTGEPGSTVQLAVRAVDAQYNSQPDNVAPLWNLRGVLNNAWHRIEIKVV